MQYSPKLKKAMEEIKAVIQKYDVGACVVLHTEPIFSEYYLNISPSYSCAFFAENGEVRVRAKLEDFKGDKEAMRLKLQNTSNMFFHLAAVTFEKSMQLTAVGEMLDKKLGATHKPGGHSSKEQQNN